MSSPARFAESAYDLISNKASKNALLQGVSGIFGFVVTLPVDVATIPLIYNAMWNEVRQLNRQPPHDSNATMTVLKQLVEELFIDLAFDKLWGNVPLIGVYFNAVCATALTWRLGTLFTCLSARGTEVDKADVDEAMSAIRDTFPHDNGMFTFATPSRRDFVALIESFAEIKHARVLELDGEITEEAVQSQYELLMRQYDPSVVRTLGQDIRDVAYRKALELHGAREYFKAKLGLD